MLQCFRAQLWATFSSFPKQIPSVYGVNAHASQRPEVISRPDFSSSTLDVNIQLPFEISSRVLKFYKSQTNNLISPPKTHCFPQSTTIFLSFSHLFPIRPTPTSSSSVNPAALHNKSQMKPLLLAFISIILQSILHQGVWSFKHNIQINHSPTPIPSDFTGASSMAQRVKNPPAIQEMQVCSLGWEDPLGEETATHTSILAWKILWTGSQRIRERFFLSN